MTERENGTGGGFPLVSWGPRATCPVCGSKEVVHIVIGEPRPGEMLTAPEWVEFAGCVIVSEDDRRCDSCGASWDSGDRD